MKAKANPSDLLNHNQNAFVREYLKDMNGSRAAIRAGYSAPGAGQQSTALLKNPIVVAEIAKGMAERAKRCNVSADQVLAELWAIAMVDTNEIIENRRVCCRYCWGDQFRYQRTPEEMRADKLNSDFVDDTGGDGFNGSRAPNEECPECFGEGVIQPFFKDTSTMSAQARALYAGVKTTKDGMEIKLHDKMAALERVGKHLGMFKEQIDLSGTLTLAQLVSASLPAKTEPTAE